MGSYGVISRNILVPVSFGSGVHAYKQEREEKEKLFRTVSRFDNGLFKSPLILLPIPMCSNMYVQDIVDSLQKQGNFIMEEKKKS